MGYDACVRIDDPLSFIRSITRSIVDLAVFNGLAECVYIDRNMPHDRQVNIHPALIKDPSYRAQTEYRAIWVPSSQTPQPMIVKCRRVRYYCTRIV